MSDSNTFFDPLAKRVTNSIDCEELAVTSAYVYPVQTPVPPTPGPRPQQDLDWCVFFLSWYKFNC